jgi:hypothetical protein
MLNVLALLTGLILKILDAKLVLPPGADQADPAWLPLVMTDAALFHAILCTSALFLYGTSDCGSIGYLIQRRHMLEAIRLINARLSGNEATSDATITTILFLAKAEVSPHLIFVVLLVKYCSIFKAITKLGVSTWAEQKKLPNLGVG